MQETHSNALIIGIRPHRITLMLGGMVGALAAAHVAVHLVSYAFGISSEQMFGLKRFFDMGMEANLPTYVSALNLLLAGGLLALIAHYESKRQQKQDWHWWGLALGCVLMSFDEATMIHDSIVGATLIRHFGRGQGIMYYAWYKLYIPLVLLIGIVYIPFLLRLAWRYLWRFLLAGMIFLSGAIGFEMLEAYLVGYRLQGIHAIQLFEETGEMIGVVVAIHTLLLYLADRDIDLLFVFCQKDPAVENPYIKINNLAV